MIVSPLGDSTKKSDIIVAACGEWLGACWIESINIGVLVGLQRLRCHGCIGLKPRAGQTKEPLIESNSSLY
jgi:hypothetical protein